MAVAAAVDPVLIGKVEQQQLLRTTVALSAVLTADHTGVLVRPGARVDRAPGARALSRWFEPDGSFQWLPCEVVAAAPDGTSWVICWEHICECPLGWAVDRQ